MFAGACWMETLPTTERCSEFGGGMGHIQDFNLIAVVTNNTKKQEGIKGDVEISSLLK